MRYFVYYDSENETFNIEKTKSKEFHTFRKRRKASEAMNRTIKIAKQFSEMKDKLSVSFVDFDFEEND